MTVKSIDAFDGILCHYLPELSERIGVLHRVAVFVKTFVDTVDVYFQRSIRFNCFPGYHVSRSCTGRGEIILAIHEVIGVCYIKEQSGFHGFGSVKISV